MRVAQTSWVGLALQDGRYRVTAVLGQGGMGVVYRARDSRDGSDVVVKVPLAALLADAEFARRFDREVRSLCRLSHPHVVRVLDVGDHNGLPFAVLEYLAGGTLRDRGGVLGGWLADLASALDYLHGRHWVHRDVKPENILFDGAGRVRLGDFGIAKAVAGGQTVLQQSQLTAPGVTIGTVQYMAPELIQCLPFDGRADQYALAVTVYELLCGQPPFAGKNAADIAHRHVFQAPKPPDKRVPGLPQAVSDAVMRGLAKDPRKRFPSCGAFAAAVLGAAPPGPAKPATRRDTPATMRIDCPSCGKIMQLPISAAGQRLCCDVCKVPFIIPAVSPGVTDPDRPRHARIPTAPEPLSGKGATKPERGRSPTRPEPRGGTTQPEPEPVIPPHKPPTNPPRTPSAPPREPPESVTKPTAPSGAPIAFWGGPGESPESVTKPAAPPVPPQQPGSKSGGWIVLFVIVCCVIAATAANLEKGRQPPPGQAPKAVVSSSAQRAAAYVEKARRLRLVGLNDRANTLKALDEGNLAIEAAPDWPTAYHERGRTYLALNRPGDALADFDEVLRREPDNIAAREDRNYADSLLRQMRPK